MALNATQLITVSEITQETLEKITAQYSSLNFSAERDAYIVTEITLWNTNRNKLKVELDGEVKFQTRTLLNEIRMRVRKMFGLPLVSEELNPGSQSVPVVAVF